MKYEGHTINTRQQVTTIQLQPTILAKTFFAILQRFSIGLIDYD